MISIFFNTIIKHIIFHSVENIAMFSKFTNAIKTQYLTYLTFYSFIIFSFLLVQIGITISYAKRKYAICIIYRD